MGGCGVSEKKLVISELKVYLPNHQVSVPLNVHSNKNQPQRKKYR